MLTTQTITLAVNFAAAAIALASCLLVWFVLTGHAALPIGAICLYGYGLGLMLRVYPTSRYVRWSRV